MVEGAPILIGAVDKSPSSECRVCLVESKGNRNVDVRLYLPISAAKVQSPTRMGIALKVEHLADLIAILQEAEGKARELGWLART